MKLRFSASALLLGTAIAAWPASAQTTATPSWSTEGRLEDSDSQDGEQRYDEHRLTLEAGRRYQISASSDDFDTVIRLYAAGADEPVATNDDYGGGFNSRVTFTPETGGEYRLRVLAYSSEGRGAYRAESAVLPPLPPAASVPAGRAFEAQGRLAAAPTETETGEEHVHAEPPFGDHRVRLEGGERYRLSASSGDFDTLLQLVREADESVVASNDDSGGELNSRMSFTPQEAGVYTLRVSSIGGNGGAYAVRAERLPPLPAPSSAPAQERAQTGWQIWQGELAASDPDNDGQLFDDYLVRMRAGETRLIMVDAGFDTTLAVLPATDRNGYPLHSDDDSGPGVNALLAFQAAEDGDYVVRVSSYGSGSAGAYRLRISEPVTPPLPAEAAGDDLGMDDHSAH